MTIHISHQTQQIVVPFSDAIGQLFPQAPRFTWNNTEWLAVAHGIDETKMLRNLNHDIPAPIVEHYPFSSADGKKPFGKQILTAAAMVMHPHCYVLNGMGTGKTKACIWAFDYLQSINKALRMLVVAPLSTLEFTWANEIFQTLPHKKVVVLNGTRERRLKRLGEPADIYIINHDGIKVIHKELMDRFDIDVICFDEAAAYRNARADRSKAAQKLSQGRRYVWGMTGSPTPTGPTDAFGLARLITPETAPRSFINFRHDTMVEVSKFRWVPKKGAAAVVADVLQPGVRFSLDDIVELPPVIHRSIAVPLGSKQRQVYDRLKEHAAAELKEGTVSAANAGVLFSKLLQTSLGWVYGTDGVAYELDNGARIDALLDIIESADRKIIVFSPFKSATRGISAKLKSEHIDYAEVTGDTPAGERAKIFTAFQHTDKYRVLNAHPECMSHGLTLTAADTIVWFGPVTKLETYEQANARITRVGQVHKQQVIHLISTPAETATYRRLADRHNLQESVLELLADITNGDPT